MDNFPFTQHKCSAIEHDYEVCQWEDMILRVKEYEREKQQSQKNVIGEDYQNEHRVLNRDVL
uniref:NADH dehydrogenase [ubiquinone] 1 beta subcomplex subunit 7 n=1 Tax=Romanomermis culicivorax TaxID=13658 RepID=A0A915JZS1_ROMCU